MDMVSYFIDNYLFIRNYSYRKYENYIRLRKDINFSIVLLRSIIYFWGILRCYFGSSCNKIAIKKEEIILISPIIYTIIQVLFISFLLRISVNFIITRARLMQSKYTKLFMLALSLIITLLAIVYCIQLVLTLY